MPAAIVMEQAKLVLHLLIWSDGEIKGVIVEKIELFFWRQLFQMNNALTHYHMLHASFSRSLSSQQNKIHNSPRAGKTMLAHILDFMAYALLLMAKHI